MREIKKMDHQQIEGRLTEAYRAGCRDGLTKSREEGRLGKELFRQAAAEALEEAKGIGPKRKELILEQIDVKMEAAGKSVCIE